MEIQTSADPAVLWLKARQLCHLGGHAPESGEIMGILQKLKDDMSAGLADYQKADEEGRKSDHATLVAAKENEVAKLTATIETNLMQGDLETGVASLSEIQTSVAPSEIWLREDLEKAYALLLLHVRICTLLALCNVGWLTTREFVVLVPDPMGFAPWSVAGPGRQE